MDKPNLVGEIFGRLTVIASTTSKHNRSRWVCSCECGNQCIATGKTLREGKKKSCGCLQRESSQRKAQIMTENNSLPDGHASCNALHATYKWNAKNKGREFSLTREYFRELTSSDCFYCGRSPSQVISAASCKTPYVYNGVDRQDNKKGYTVENSVACCGTCNDMKRARSVEDFMNACKAVVDHKNFKLEKLVEAQSRIRTDFANRASR